jgi:hypothetical protein
MYGISNDYVFTHLNLNKKVKGQYYFSDAKIRLEIEKFINKYITLSDQKYNDLLESAAATLGKSTSETIQIVSDILTQKYVEERTAYQEIPDDEFLDKKITTLFSIVIRKEPYNFKNVSRHFMNRAEPEQLNDIIEDMMTVLAKNKQGTDYIFKKGGKTYTYPSEQVDNLVSGYAQTMFDQATDYQYQKSASDVESGEFDVVLSDEDKAAQAFAKKIAKLSTTTNFDNLAPFFGFSGASGLRQWYLKHALRKIKGLGIGLSPGGDKEGFAKLYEETFEAIAPFLGDALEAKIKELESQPTLDDQGKQKLLIVKHALPQIRELDQVIQSGNFLIGQEEGKEEGHDLLYTVGGYILRSVNGEIYKPIMNVIDKDWTSFVAEIIQSKTTANAKTSKSLAEYFTGKKEIPDYDEMTKAAKNLLKAGIDYKIFTEILDASNDWFDDTLSTEFDQFDTGEDTIQGEFLQAILKTIEKLTKKPKEMSKQLDKAIDEYLKDLAYQIAFKNLSQYETESGD